MPSVLLDSLIDSLKVLPFLFAIYILIELLETSKKAKARTVRLLNGKVAPLFAGAVGVIPQCGFSVMTADLYLSGYVKMGTLVAVFVATSDEALPILFTNSGTFVTAWVVLAIKIVYAVLLGYLVNIFDKRQLAAEIPDEELHTDGCCHHEMEHKQSFVEFMKHPVVHSLKIFVYLLAVNIVFGTLLYYFEEQIAAFMTSALWAQPFLTALIGLIPNCGSSVAITGLYVKGVVSFAALLSGLVANSGIALAVLFKSKKNLKNNLVILGIVYTAGVVLGTIITAVTL
jgi:hypothetical protein